MWFHEPQCAGLAFNTSAGLFCRRAGPRLPGTLDFRGQLDAQYWQGRSCRALVMRDSSIQHSLFQRVWPPALLILAVAITMACPTTRMQDTAISVAENRRGGIRRVVRLEFTLMSSAVALGLERRASTVDYVHPEDQRSGSFQVVDSR